MLGRHKTDKTEKRRLSTQSTQGVFYLVKISDSRAGSRERSHNSSTTDLNEYDERFE